MRRSADRQRHAPRREQARRQGGLGLIDPLAALSELDAQLADTKVAGTAPAPAATQTAAPARTPAMAAPASVTTRPALPRPGVYLPKQ